MKAILVAVVGTAGLLANPAVAGTSKKQPAPKAQKEQVAKPKAGVVVADASTEAATAVAVAQAVAAPSASPELLALPDLPADTAGVFAQVSLPAPVVVGKPSAKPTKAPVMNIGKDYVLGAKRQSAKPGEEVQQIIPRGLARSTVSTYIDAHADEIQLCWSRIPAAQRPDACTVNLDLTISDSGKVTDIELGGDVPAGAHKCIVHAVSHWQFPVAETSTQIEYGISLHSI
jgi:cytoskeletal protein RodZ